MIAIAERGSVCSAMRPPCPTLPESFNDIAAQQMRCPRAVTTDAQSAQAYGLRIACHVAQVETVWAAWCDANSNSAADHYRREIDKAASTVKALFWDYSAPVHKGGGWGTFFHRVLVRVTGGRDVPREEHKTARTLAPSPLYGQSRRWHPYQEPEPNSSSSGKGVKEGSDKRKSKGDKNNSKNGKGDHKGKPEANKGDRGKPETDKGDRGKLGAGKGDKGKGKDGKPVGKGKGPLPPQPPAPAAQPRAQAAQQQQQEEEEGEPAEEDSTTEANGPGFGDI
ncbi:unnamed protein product [Amoebophrya sp. A25]|nr:unnamed protein product [Amoebophrya sp. A25]|eukprot:GSA25T00027572001.1